MIFYFLTLFPDIIEVYFQTSMMKRAVDRGIIQYKTIDIRCFSEDKHHRVDDTPYGGGAGMVMAAPPITRALKSISNWEALPVVHLTPSGQPFIQEDACTLTKHDGLIFVCGHYEGIDQRFIDQYVTLEYSAGDFVLTGGELPALLMADAISRNIQGFLGNQESLAEESFENGLLEYPHYTRPAVFEEHTVPDVLLSGNHQAIRDWRAAKALERTKKRRPDLLKKSLQ